MEKKTNKLIATATVVLIGVTRLFAQEPTCIKQGKNLPENDCAPCTLDTRYNVVVQNLLELDEIYRMEDEMNKMVEEMDAVYKTFGNLKQKGFDELDMNLKKLYEEAKHNPQRAMDLISWMESELEKAGCNKKGRAFDTRSDGVSTGGLQSVSDNATSAIKNLTFPNYQGPAQFTFDCCENPRWQPNDVLIANAQQIHTDFLRMTKMFEDFKLLHLVQIRAVQQAVWQFQQYDAESQKKMERLVNSSFCDVICDALAQSGATSAPNKEFIREVIKNFDKNNDIVSAKNAIRQVMGDDAAEVFGFYFEKYTATQMLQKLSEIVNKNKDAGKLVRGLGDKVKGVKWLNQFMDIVALAESSVNVFFDTFLKLGGNSFVIKTQNELWCIAAQYYYYAMQSVLTNAAALNNMKKAVQKVHSYFPDTVIPLEEMDGLTAMAAQQKISTLFGSKDLRATLQGNRYTVQLTDGKYVVFVFGKFFCGKYKSYPKAETTPNPKPNKKTSPITAEHTINFNSDSTVVVFNNYDGEKKDYPQWSGGFICGTGWNTRNGAMPFYREMNSSEFVQQHQTELNAAFDGTTFSKAEAIKIITFPGVEAGLGVGCAVNHTWGIRAEITGGWQATTAETDVRVVRIVLPPNPSQPPSTQQSTEVLKAKSSAGALRVNVGPTANFGNKVQGFVGAGVSTGFIVINKIEYIAGAKTFTTRDLKIIPNAGGYVNAGAKIPFEKKWCFVVEAEGRFLATQKNFVASPGLKIGVAVKF